MPFDDIGLAMLGDDENTREDGGSFWDNAPVIRAPKVQGKPLPGSDLATFKIGMPDPWEFEGFQTHPARRPKHRTDPWLLALPRPKYPEPGAPLTYEVES